MLRHLRHFEVELLQLRDLSLRLHTTTVQVVVRASFQNHDSTMDAKPSQYMCNCASGVFRQGQLKYAERAPG